MSMDYRVTIEPLTDWAKKDGEATRVYECDAMLFTLCCEKTDNPFSSGRGTKTALVTGIVGSSYDLAKCYHVLQGSMPPAVKAALDIFQMADKAGFSAAVRATPIDFACRQATGNSAMDGLASAIEEFLASLENGGAGNKEGQK